jgi:hypothetical protein
VPGPKRPPLVIRRGNCALFCALPQWEAATAVAHHSSEFLRRDAGIWANGGNEIALHRTWSRFSGNGCCRGLPPTVTQEVPGSSRRPPRHGKRSNPTSSPSWGDDMARGIRLGDRSPKTERLYLAARSAGVAEILFPSVPKFAEAAQKLTDRCFYRYKENGAEGRNRTGDLTITNRLLYQLSYLGRIVLNLASPAKNIKPSCHRPTKKARRENIARAALVRKRIH